MTDPDFVMTFTIVRRVPTVNTFGENTLAETTVNAVGSIQAATGETAKRLPDGVQLSNFKTIFTKAVIKADAAGKYVDQIEIKGQRFNVFQVLPWEDFGAGWFMVDCELQRKSL
jgi:hypothetical protein